MLSTLNVQTLTALANLLMKEAKARRETLTPGEYSIDEQVTLDVKGLIRVFEDHSYQPTTSIPLKVTLALFLRYSGVTGQHAISALVRAMSEALVIDELPKEERRTTVEAIRELADLEEAERIVTSSLEQLPPQNRKGRVNVKATVNPAFPVIAPSKGDVERAARVSAEEGAPQEMLNPVTWRQYVEFFSGAVGGQVLIPF